MKFAYITIGIVFAFGMFAVIGIFDQISGQYTYGGNMGAYYAGGGWVQFSPEEACEVSGGHSFDPPQVFHNDFNTVMALCYYTFPELENDHFGVPLVQWVTVPPTIGRYTPTG